MCKHTHVYFWIDTAYDKPNNLIELMKQQLGNSHVPDLAWNSLWTHTSSSPNFPVVKNKDVFAYRRITRLFAHLHTNKNNSSLCSCISMSSLQRKLCHDSFALTSIWAKLCSLLLLSISAFQVVEEGNIQPQQHRIFKEWQSGDALMQSTLF